MIFFCFIWFLALYAGTFFIARKDDLFSPLRFTAIKHALSNLLFILYIAIYPNLFFKKILSVCNVTVEEAFKQYTVVQTVAYISLLAGIIILRKRPEENIGELKLKELNYKNLKILALALFAVGISGYMYFLYTIGGIGYLLENIEKRVSLQSGQYILITMPLALVGCLMMLLMYSLGKKKYDLIIFIVSAVVLAVAYSSFGSRKNTVVFIILIIVGIHYFIKKLRFERKVILRFVLLTVPLVAYVLIVPSLRGDVKKGSPFTARQFVYHTSYTFIDVFAANYFHKGNTWDMQGYMTSIKDSWQGVPKDSLPQIDQGVYFRSTVYHKKDFRPTMPRAKADRISWPTENFGFAYANFLLPGIVIFFFLQGCVFSLLYRIYRYDLKNPAALCLYVIAILTFNFSSLRIAWFIKVAPLLYFCYVLFNFFVRGKTFLDSLKIKI